MFDRVRLSLRERLHRKQLAYVRTFCGDNGKLHLSGEKVLADLKKFCGMHRAGIVVSPITRVVDPYATAYLAGQRDVLLRITKMLDLDINQVQESNDVQTTADG